MIEPHDHDHFGSLIVWLHDNWPLAVALFAVVTAAFWGVLHKIFASHKKVEICKEDLLSALHAQEERGVSKLNGYIAESKKHHEELREQHRETNKTLSLILNKLIPDRPG